MTFVSTLIAIINESEIGDGRGSGDRMRRGSKTENDPSLANDLINNARALHVGGGV